MAPEAANLDVQNLAAEIAAAIRIEQLPEHPFSPWLNADEAAAYLRCPTSRIRKLTCTRELPCHRDGRRVLYHRDELDAYIRAGGAICP
jgi:excisionase family DNA binding protein